MLRSGLTAPQVVERTRLPRSVVDGLATPILQDNAERKAVEEAEHVVECERRRMLREEYPCPLCGKGYAVAEGGTLTVFPNGAVRPADSAEPSKPAPFFRPWWARCSRRECVAQLVFPRDSEADALAAFTAGEWVRPHPFVGIDDGSCWTWTRTGRRNRVAGLLDRYSTEQVERFGFNPPAVERLANQLALWRMEHDLDAFDTTLMCPKCGHKGRIPESRQSAQPQQETMVLLVAGRLPALRGQDRQLVFNPRTGASRVRRAERMRTMPFRDAWWGAWTLRH